jgi:hypothetical protein
LKCHNRRKQHSRSHNGKRRDTYIAWLEHNRITVDTQQGGIRPAQLYPAETGLPQHKQRTGNDAGHTSAHHYEPALRAENTPDKATIGTHGAQNGHVGLLVDNQHGKRGYDVGRGYKQNEGKHHKGYPFLDCNHAERLFLLTVAVLDLQCVLPRKLRKRTFKLP